MNDYQAGHQGSIMPRCYLLHALGYEYPPSFASMKDAKQAMLKNVAKDRKLSHYKLVQIRHSPKHIELRIGSVQGIHTYSEYWIEEQE
jgi:hypothetical protein